MRQDGIGSASSTHFDLNGDIAIVGFLVFLIIQSTIGLFILASVFAICSRRKGYVKRYSCYDCWMPGPSIIDNGNWVKVTDDQNYVCCGGLSKCRSYGPTFYYSSMLLFMISIVFTTVVVGVYGGRAIAVNNMEQCMPYRNTSIGLLGCVDHQSGSYVGDRDCTNCAGVGFGILGFSLFAIELIVVAIYFFSKGWCGLW